MKGFLLFLFCCLLPPRTWALLPLQTYEDLAAGSPAMGYQDGPFYAALFHGPQGLAFNTDGTLLYVADGENHCIRVVDRGKGNLVSTLTGGGKAGYADGPLAAALFSHPTLLLFLPGQQLVVYDEGNARLRLVDLAQKTVTTLAGDGEPGLSDGPGAKASLGNLSGMAYLPSRGGVYFSSFGALRKVDLKTGQVSTVFRGKAEVPALGAMTVDQGRLYLADGTSGQVYQLTPKEKFDREDETSFDWQPFAKGQAIGQMAFSDGVLYAVQRGGAPFLARLTPQYQPVTFVSLWGDEQSQSVGSNPLLGGEGEGNPCFLAPDPLSPRKLYFSHPGANMVTSYRDLFLEEFKDSESENPEGLTDFRYPTAKPPGTFRILLVGDSHTFHQYPDDVKKRGWNAFNRFAILPKRAEETLNTLAALQDVPWHYEVLHYGEVSGNHLNLWPYYVVPRLAKKFDVDLVVIMYSPDFDLGPFYDYPYSAEGIPVEKQDNEFLLKPVEQRIQGGLPRELFDYCKAHELVKVINHQAQFAPFDRISGDPQAAEKLIQLTARPLKLLDEKLNGMKTSTGAPVRLEMVRFPLGRFPGPYEGDQAYWGKYMKEINAPLLDLTAAMSILRFSYYPLSQVGGYDHFNADGHLLMGFLLAEELIREKLIPFEPAK